MKKLSARVARANFSGRILERGFWLYVWKVTAPNKTVFYVGRTGDSSSANAASPFSRLSAHLETKPTAKGNSMHCRLVSAGIDPTDAEFEMAAAGPLFPEQTTFEDHRQYRNRMAAMEKELAQRLEEGGWTVVGTHASKHDVDRQDRDRLDEILSQITEALR